ncbi:hypothetical protein, partial [Vibrio parahaemolyticus]|uniref:hypothetical protein n=1 Tax=Vibrio parahaemolyticus TaxID=670 RepID=UPI0030811611
VYYHFANAHFSCSKEPKSGVVSKRLLLKPLGTNSAVEYSLTTPKSSFEKTISQSGLSTSESASETANQNHTNKHRTQLQQTYT